MRLPVIEKFVVKNGPEIYRKSDSESFVLKNSRNIMTWIGEDGRVLSMQQRELYDAKKFLEQILRKNPVHAGVPSGIIPDIRRSFRVLHGGQPVSKSIKKALAEVTSTDGLVFSSTQ